METIKLIIMICSFVLTLAGAVSPFFIKLAKANNARKAAVTEAQKEKAANEMLEIAQELIMNAEKVFAGFDVVMKQQNASAGSLKKENVTTKLQAYALAKGYTYDAEYWSAKIDEIVKFTKSVNAKKTA